MAKSVTEKSEGEFWVREERKFSSDAVSGEYTESLRSVFAGCGQSCPLQSEAWTCLRMFKDGAVTRDWA